MHNAHVPQNPQSSYYAISGLFLSTISLWEAKAYISSQLRCGHKNMVSVFLQINYCIYLQKKLARNG
jgi:hypothetical protein